MIKLAQVVHEHAQGRQVNGLEFEDSRVRMTVTYGLLTRVSQLSTWWSAAWQPLVASSLRVPNALTG